MVELLGNIKMTDGRVAATQTVKDLDSVYINEDGTIYGIHSVHGIIMLGRIDIVTFDNPNGLEQVGKLLLERNSFIGSASGKHCRRKTVLLL